MNTQKRFSSWARGSVAVAALALCAQALAAKDVIYPSSATATSDGSSINVSNSFSTGADGSTSVTNDVGVNSVYPGSAVSVTVGWSIQNKSGPGVANTAYSRTVNFTSSTTVGSPVTVSPIGSCSVSSAASTCSTAINFAAPATPGSYQIRVLSADAVQSPATTRLEATSEYINFTVIEPVVVAKLDTQLNVDQQCVVYRDPTNAALTATLSETNGGSPVENGSIDFYVNPELDGSGTPTVASVGSAYTGADGQASLAYDVSGLSVGDHNLYAEYAGDATYNGSNDSNILGVSYNFGGFRPPLNADGTSIFGGRVIPIKIKLTDALGNPVSDAAPLVWLVRTSLSGVGEVVEPATSVSSADSGNIMRYSVDDQQYVYNFDANDLPNGVYKIRVSIGDSAACSSGPREVTVTISRKGKK